MYRFEGKKSYKINMKLNESKERWRVEKAALELVDAQSNVKEVSGRAIMSPL